MKNSRSIRRYVAAGAVAAVSMAGITACTSEPGDSANGETTITWWHNATADPQKGALQIG